ncbi:MAG: lysophospholipid acyltransferase family protein [Nitrospiraceae bacterium]|nr:lysophospholipid acyltransferase family protein [Nitrospiraceae bacterium]
MKRVLWILQFLLILLVTLPIAVLPFRVSLKLGECLGGLLFFSWGSRRRIAIGNLELAVARNALSIDATPEQIIRENFSNLGKSFVEVVKIYYGLGDRIIRSVEITGVEHFLKARENGAGILVITGHCGNWELNALAVAKKLVGLNIVARPIDNPYLNLLIEKTRKKYGSSVIYKKGALKRILSALKRNEVVAILMDQSVVSSEGVVADFLGKKDYTMKTPAVIAMKTGSPVLSAFIKRTNGGHVIEIGEVIELDSSADAEEAVLLNTVNFSKRVEDYVRRNPAEWLWIHRRWKRFQDG